MVVFSCSQCGDTIKKKKATEHLTKCGKGELSCVDCGVSFPGSSYELHFKCITEEQKYEKPGTVVGSIAKGDQKQFDWFRIVQTAIYSKEASPKCQELLNCLLSFTNTPRKQKKFMNFVTNSIHGFRTDVIAEAWDVISRNNKGRVGDSIADAENNSKVDITNGKNGPCDKIVDESQVDSIAEDGQNTQDTKKRKKDRKSKNGVNGIAKEDEACDPKIESNVMDAVQNVQQGNDKDSRKINENKKKHKKDHSGVPENGVIDTSNLVASNDINLAKVLSDQETLQKSQGEDEVSEIASKKSKRSKRKKEGTAEDVNPDMDKLQHEIDTSNLVASNDINLAKVVSDQETLQKSQGEDEVSEIAPKRSKRSKRKKEGTAEDVNPDMDKLQHETTSVPDTLQNQIDRQDCKKKRKHKKTESSSSDYLNATDCKSNGLVSDLKSTATEKHMSRKRPLTQDVE